ncbi:MAG: BrnT family toxin [Gammaproteobacteria bacterium]
MQFEWDWEKAQRNERKHGVSFVDACTVFDDDHASTVVDPDHSEGEVRHLTFGMSNSGKALVVAHTDRGANIRIISAQAMTPRERKAYEQ